jgi:hypothetical protein
MINAEEIRTLQKQTPFRPFKLHLSDGRSFAVMHPEQFMVLRHRVVLGLPETADIPERSENLSMLHITSVEEVAA